MATMMEGPLSKWTNVMKGWQYRWFVLDENSGLLSYYTSKEKMMRGARRGCVRLKGAVIGIDDEDDSTFTITVDQKTFHFQARDSDEKEKWIDGLEATILRHSQPIRRWDGTQIPSINNFDKKLTETDMYLQILIDQVQDFTERISACEDEEMKAKYTVIKNAGEDMIESIKQSIVLLQITKHSLREKFPPPEDNEILHIESLKSVMNGHDEHVITPDCLSLDATSQPNHRDGVLSSSHTHRAQSPVHTHSDLITRRTSDVGVPDSSYSTSEDEDFYDAEEETRLDEGEEPHIPPKVIASQDDYFDELYDNNTEEDLAMEGHGSMITHLLSQVRIGMDLTKVVLPTFILEKRSLLEMFADFFAHPDMFVGIVDQVSPRDRMVQTVRWYLSAFHAGRRSHVAKKPYNPILGETFRCYYDIPGVSTEDQETVTDGPIPWARNNNLCFLAEQVSHHPPISAFYAECVNKRISMDGYIWTKSKFLGLSIGVHMIGQALISVPDHDEEYIVTFPNAYGRSILTVPWMEMGGKVNITCPKTGYYANIDFLTKPFYGGKKDLINADIFSPADKKSFCNIKGEWNGVMWAKYTSGMNEIFVDTKNSAVFKKKVQPIEQQEEFESRRLWQEVTFNLKEKNIEAATNQKHKLEQRQREEAKARKEKGEKWETKLFHEVGEHWLYDKPLVKRLQPTS